MTRYIEFLQYLLILETLALVFVTVCLVLVAYFRPDANRGWLSARLRTPIQWGVREG